MKLSHPQYIIDDTGKKLSVILPFKEYERIIKELDEKLSNSTHTKLKGRASGLRGKIVANDQ